MQALDVLTHHYGGFQTANTSQSIGRIHFTRSGAAFPRVTFLVYFGEGDC